MVAWSFRARVVLHRMLATFTFDKMIIVLNNVSACIYLFPRMFLYTDFLFEKRTGQVTMDALYQIY